MRYQIYPKHAPAIPGRKLCLSNVLQDDSPQTKVCRQETGKNPYKDTGHWNWTY